MNRIGDGFVNPWTAGIGMPGPRLDGNKMVDRMITEVIKAVITQMMSQGVNPMTGQPQVGQGGFPLSPDPFGASAFAGIGSPCGGGAQAFQGAPDLGALGSLGALPNILGAAPEPAAQSPCGCGSQFNDPRAVLTGFDSGQLLAQQLFSALPGNIGPAIGGIDPAALQAQLPQIAQPAVDPQLLAGAGAGQTPAVFNALNVNQDLKNWAGACGSKGCCKWEPAIA